MSVSIATIIAQQSNPFMMTIGIDLSIHTYVAMNFEFNIVFGNSMAPSTVTLASHSKVI